MKQFLFIISSIILLLSCQSKEGRNSENSIKISENRITGGDKSTNRKDNEVWLTEHQIDSLTKEADRLFDQQLLTKYFYPNMSGCGGGLYGYYKDSTLCIIDAVYQGELGFSSRKMYWYDGRIIKINYREHFAEWARYEENYPADKFEWDPNKMTYTDTIYQITLGIKYQMQKMACNKIISEKQDSILINRLLNCGFEMKKELENERRLDN